MTIFCYGSGDAIAIREVKQPDDEVFLAIMRDNIVEYKLIVSAPSLEDAEEQIEMWIENHKDEGASLDKLERFDLEDYKTK